MRVGRNFYKLRQAFFNGNGMTVAGKKSLRCNDSVF